MQHGANNGANNISSSAANNVNELPPASVETQLKAIVRMQKLFRQRKEWKSVIEEREWKVRNILHSTCVVLANFCGLCTDF
jgi:hypothetical protein